jgi:hypothetical protein
MQFSGALVCTSVSSCDQSIKLIQIVLSHAAHLGEVTKCFHSVQVALSYAARTERTEQQAEARCGTGGVLQSSVCRDKILSNLNFREHSKR